MKDISELLTPGDCRYSDDHEWARVEVDRIRVGITDYAQNQLGDIVYVELPEVGKSIEKNREFGVVESVKSVSDMLIPVSGEIVAVNLDLNNSPNLINESPYERGWIIEVKPSDPSEINELMTSEEYLKMLKGDK